MSPHMKGGDDVNAGELHEKIEIMNLSSSQINTNTVYVWSVAAEVWAKSELVERTNAFSRVGKGVKTVKFTIRKRALNLQDAIRWQGKFCFLTAISEIEHMYYEVTAALIEPKICIVQRMDCTSLDELNHPVLTQSAALTFPGCLTQSAE